MNNLNWIFWRNRILGVKKRKVKQVQCEEMRNGWKDEDRGENTGSALKSSLVILSKALLQIFQVEYGKEITKFRDNTYATSDICKIRYRIYGEMKYYRYWREKSDFFQNHSILLLAWFLYLALIAVIRSGGMTKLASCGESISHKVRPSLFWVENRNQIHKFIAFQSFRLVLLIQIYWPDRWHLCSIIFQVQLVLNPNYAWPDLKWTDIHF